MGDFNAQLGNVGKGEDHIIGPFVFGKAIKNKAVTKNRELLMEYCMTHNLQVANTFFDYPADSLVSYFGLGVKPMDEIVSTRFSQIDHILVPQCNFDMVYVLLGESYRCYKE